MSTLRTKIVFEIEERDLPAVMASAKARGIVEPIDGDYTKQQMQDAIRAIALKAFRSALPHNITVIAHW